MATSTNSRQSPCDRYGAIVVEAHAIDESAIGNKPEEARAGVSGLGEGGNGSHFDVTETEIAQTTGHRCVLVETGRHAERRGEIYADDTPGETRIGSH